MSWCVCQQMRQSKIGWPCKGYRCCQLCWPFDVPISWTMHCHASCHMLGWGIPVVLGGLAVREALLEVLALGWLAWVACCRCLGVVASLPLCGSGVGIQIFGYTFCGYIRALFEVTASDCLQQS
jgi:hypothetical protein